MSGIIRVTPAELQAMSGKYTTESGETEHQITRLDKMIEDLQGMWEGESSKAFAEQFHSLRPSFVEMQNLLSDIASQLSAAGRALEDADQQIAGQIRG
ncbi:WXG100 family type VII secretion target [Rummeliibacillus pycnus]|uniref:WXG100 family type VII secretion target n=1 Tax=Rummeliibacillus pycnus TaxID=101070 RepID=UPI0037CA6510